MRRIGVLSGFAAAGDPMRRRISRHHQDRSGLSWLCACGTREKERHQQSRYRVPHFPLPRSLSREIERNSDHC